MSLKLLLVSDLPAVLDRSEGLVKGREIIKRLRERYPDKYRHYTGQAISQALSMMVNSPIVNEPHRHGYKLR